MIDKYSKQYASSSSSSFEVSKQMYEDQTKEFPDYIKMSLMQKDKRIMELNSKIAESASYISKLKQTIDQKEKDHNQLKAIIQELSSEIEMKSKEINSSQTTIDAVKEETKIENEALRKKNKKQSTQINDLISKSSQYQIELEDHIEQGKSFQMTLLNKDKEISEQKAIIKKYEEWINGLTKDNQQIASLNHNLIESKAIIDKFTQQEQKTKEDMAYLLNENESVNNYIQTYIDNYQKAKWDYENHISSLDNQLIGISKQLQQKASEASIEKQKRKVIVKEIDQLISYMVNQLSLILLNIEHGSISPYENNLLSSSMGIKGLEWLNDSKYDLLKGNIIKINDLLNDNNNKLNLQYKMLKKNIDGLTIENKELLSKIETHRKNEAFNKNTIEELKKQSSKFAAFNENYNGLKNKYMKLSSDYEELIVRRDAESNDNKHFLQLLCEKLKKNTSTEELDFSSCTNASVLKYVDILNDNSTQFRIKIEIKESEIESILKAHEEIEKEYKEKQEKLNEKIAKMAFQANTDLQKVKEISSNQIRQLTKLLEESKLMLLKYRNDYDILLEEKSKLEYRLQSVQSLKEKEEETASNN